MGQVTRDGAHEKSLPIQHISVSQYLFITLELGGIAHI